jgi:hypothetical protein
MVENDIHIKISLEIKLYIFSKKICYFLDERNITSI